MTINQKVNDEELDMLLSKLGISHDKFLEIQHEDLNEMGV